MQVNEKPWTVIVHDLNRPIGYLDMCQVDNEIPIEDHIGMRSEKSALGIRDESEV
jgi:hypothetical protein